MRIFSTPGLGTTVRLYLPQDERGGEAVSVQPPLQARGGTESILLVEDNDLVRGHAETLLDSLGYSVCAVGRAQDALLQLRGRHFDLLFTDIVMPGGMNGRQLAEETQRLYPGLPILLTSGYAQDVLAAGGLPQSLPVLQKPYRRHELATAIRRLLDRADAGPPF